jgi:uncharacterized protein DUF1707/cell wall-active antibiotic response 4TMS protein YvqF
MTEGQPPAIRVSDADRDRAATALAQARAEGRLTLDEFSERVDLAYAAKTATDLEPLTRDLPAGGSTQPSHKPTRWLVAVMGGSRRTGRWRIEGSTRVFAVMGGCQLDLRAAEIVGPEARITCFSCMGGVRIIVPEGVEVDVTGFTLMGGRDIDVKGARRRAGTPFIRIRAIGLMGGLVVQTPRPKLPT